jgi:hypothetical protein
MTREFVGVCALTILIAVATLPDPAGATWTPFNYEGADAAIISASIRVTVSLFLPWPSL